MLTNSSYEIKTQNFEGPLDVLLNLISKHEIDIYDISISQITDEYLTYIEQMKELNLEIASEFLLIAATLLEIKSQRLLPGEKKEQVEELSPDEVRRELTKRLINYRKFKDAASNLGVLLESGSKYYLRNAELEDRFLELIPDFTGEIETDRLATTMVEIISRSYYAKINDEHITPITITVEDQIEILMDKLKESSKLNFRQFTKDLEKMEAIVSFLAILELFKKGEVDIKQGETFGDIEVERIDG